MERTNDMDVLTRTLSEKPYSILVAEDSDSNQALIELYFKQTACKLDFVGDGAEAVALFEQGDYDLVLMDIQMPKMDGYIATTRIRDIELARGSGHVPVVAVTANAFKEDEEQCLAAGCTDYLAKPVRKAELLQTVARHLVDNA